MHCQVVERKERRRLKMSDEAPIEYYATVLFVQAVAEDGKISPDEAKAVEEALGGFLEGMESEEDAMELLDEVAGNIQDDIEGYQEDLEEAIKFFAGQKKELKTSLLDLMKDLAGADGVSAQEKKFFQGLKGAWKI